MCETRQSHRRATANFRPPVPYWFSNAPETNTAPARPDADVLRHRRPDPRHRHRRQHRDLQHRPGHSAEAPALSAVGRARHDRSLGAGHQPAERRRGSLPLFHLSRTGTDVSGRRVVEHRDGQRHRTRRARGSADAVRHRRGFADPRRAAAAGALVLEVRRGGRRARDGHPHVGVLAVEVRRRIIGHRPDADARQQTARSDRRAPGELSIPRSPRVARRPLPARSQQDVSRTVQLQRRRAAETRYDLRAGPRRTSPG